MGYYTPLFSSYPPPLRTFLVPPFPTVILGTRACLCKSCSSDGKREGKYHVIVSWWQLLWKADMPALPLMPQEFSAIEYPLCSCGDNSFAVPRSTFAASRGTCRFSFCAICLSATFMPFSPWPPWLCPELDSGRADNTDENMGQSLESWYLFHFLK